jgi:glutamyl-tRNA synthetase
MRDRDWKRPPAVRLSTPDRTIALADRWQGAIAEHVEGAVGDFVLRRGDHVYAYQLAVVVDDLAMGITEVVRGCDLLGSAARQALLCDLLGRTPPSYAHHAMIVSTDGSRLAKRAGGVTLRDQRDAGVSPGAVVASLAASLGLVEGDRSSISPRELLSSFDPARLAGKREARALAIQ